MAHYVAVLVSISKRLKLSDPSNRAVMSFLKDENYSLEAVQDFLEDNQHIFGPNATAHCEILHFNSIEKLLDLVDDTMKNEADMPPFTGWTLPPMILSAR